VSLFQVLDDKNYNCKRICVEGTFYELEEVDKPIITDTWNYYPYLEDLPIEYAQLYAEGKTPSQVCPEGLKEEFKQINNKLKAYYRSFATSKINLDKYCFYDLVPDKVVREYARIKDLICKYVFDTYDKPENYNHMLKIIKIITDIRPLNIDKRMAKMINYNKCPSGVLSYNPFTSKTGRLGINSKSFPILNIKKEDRVVIVPHNDMFVNLDYNAAELRVLLGLNGEKQPSIDIHEHNRQILKKDKTRTEVKKMTFAWLYGSEREEHVEVQDFGFAYDKKKILDKYYRDGIVYTDFRRKIKADDHHALSYIIQSTASDMFLEQVYEIRKLLKGKKSFVSFMVHDNVAIDLHREDRSLVREIKRIFEDTRYGKILSTLEMGKNFGEMEKINI
jgi:hypothetical protein